jgi:chemotaxis protein MotB
MAGQSNAAPVIIKRKKIIQGGGHHGGAWKVAYADFVTAMMAFFMLMWLLNATTEKQRKGIADYFNPTIPINRVSGGGDGAFGGDSVFTEKTLAQVGMGATAMMATEARAARGEKQDKTGKSTGQASDQQEVMKDVVRTLIARGGESQTMEHLLRHVITRVTDEGLVIELFDLEDQPLFVGDTDQPSDALKSLASLLAQVLAVAENQVAIDAYVKTYPITMIQNPVWDLSSARAQMARALIAQAGLDDGRMDRISGHADRKPAVADPTAARNNRIEVVLIRKDR